MAAKSTQLIIAHETEQVSESPFYIPMTGPGDAAAPLAQA